MKNLHIYLLGILAVQLVITFSLFSSESNKLAKREATEFLAINPEAISKIEIKDASQSVSLVRKNEEWEIASLANLPVAASKVSDNLNALAEINVSWPVATTSSAKKRFEVHADKFQRQVELFEGEKSLGTFYLGSSPSFRKVHARKNKDDNIYAITFNSFDLPAANDQWLDKTLIAADEITSIKTTDFVLSKSGENWSLVNKNAASDQFELDEEKATKFFDVFASLRVQNVRLDPLKFGDSKTTTIEITSKNGNWAYQLIEQENQYYIKRNDRDAMFTLTKTNYDQIATVNLAWLQKQVEQEAETSNNGASALEATETDS